MEGKNKDFNSETLAVGIILAAVGGFLDVYTYITRGKVFANAQTGNIVLMGINIAEGRFIHALYYIVPILSFIIGTFTVEFIKFKFKPKGKIHYRQIVILFETIIISIVAFVPSGIYNILVNASISLVSSMQIQCFRKLNGNPFATTMCTGNLRSAGDNMCQYLKTEDRKFLRRSLEYLTIILFFVIGAIVGVLITNRINELSILVCSLLLIICFLMTMTDIELEGDN